MFDRIVKIKNRMNLLTLPQTLSSNRVWLFSCNFFLYFYNKFIHLIENTMKIYLK